MIQINLLPEAEGRARRARPARAAAPGGALATAVVVAAGVAVAAVIGGVFYQWSWLPRVEAQKALKEAEDERTRVQTQINRLSPEASEIREARARLDQQLEILNALDPPQRVLWSQKFNMLAHLIPAEVFLNRMELTEQVVEVETEDSKRRRREWEEAGRPRDRRPVVVKKPVVTYTLRVNGLASGADNVEQLNNMMKFHDALQAYEDESGNRFIDGFNADIGVDLARASVYEGFNVTEFTFVLKTIPAGAEATPARSPAAS